MNFAPFVLKCPECAAPSAEFATNCTYCKIPLQWRPIISLGALEDYEPRITESPNELPLAFGPEAIRGGDTYTFAMSPQIPVRPNRLILQPSIAESVIVNDIRIGMRSQFANASPVPGYIFAPGALGIAMSFDDVNVGLILSITLTNITAQALNISGVFKCKNLDPNLTLDHPHKYPHKIMAMRQVGIRR